MNKQEQSQLCALLAKLRYDLMEMHLNKLMGKKEGSEEQELIKAINKILTYTYLDGRNKD